MLDFSNDAFCGVDTEESASTIYTAANLVSKQLILNINLSDAATFENFFLKKGDINHTVVAVLENQQPFNDNPFVYLWGAHGSGVSHLLQASCHRASSKGLSAQYLSLSEFLDYSPEELLGSLDEVSLICLDNIEAIAGKARWEEELFNLYNRVRDSGRSLLVGSNCSTRELLLGLPDLKSRYAWGPVFQLHASDDGEKLKILQFRALQRGMHLNDDLAKYMIARASREMKSLMRCLDILEEASLQEKRKLSIPFVRKTFSW
jgi:DnaA family protein